MPVCTDCLAPDARHKTAAGFPYCIDCLRKRRESGDTRPPIVSPKGRRLICTCGAPTTRRIVRYDEVLQLCDACAKAHKSKMGRAAVQSRYRQERATVRGLEEEVRRLRGEVEALQAILRSLSPDTLASDADSPQTS